MRHFDGRFTGVRGRSIYFQCWGPEVAPSAIVLIAHGAGEHSGRYHHVAQFFTGHNYAVAALDHNGHGNSDGVPGHVQLFEDYLQDMAIFHRQLLTHLPAVPMFLLGHSMGGLIASNYLLRNQKDFLGAILSGPAIKTDLQPGPVQLSLLRLVSAVFPRLRMLKLDATGVSRDPEVVRAYVEDPLVLHGKMTARMCQELFVGMSAIQAAASNISIPILILHGGDDVMASPEGSRWLYDHVSSTDKTLNIYLGLYHEIFNEPERADILDTVLQWCNRRLEQTAIQS